MNNLCMQTHALLDMHSAGPTQCFGGHCDTETDHYAPCAHNPVMHTLLFPTECNNGFWQHLPL